MTWRERIGYGEEEFLPLPIAASAYILGVCIRKVWLYICAPLGSVAVLIALAQLALDAMGLSLNRA